MSSSRWYVHPIFIFILSITALSLSLFLYIYWYIEISSGMEVVIEKFNLDPRQIFESKTWVVILLLSILCGIILFGFNIIFVYLQKTRQLYRLQNNFINNFTHELKTPVTSLQIYLETFRKHDLSREEQHRYIGYMLADVERLSGTINSILNLAKIESKAIQCRFNLVDLFEALETFLKRNGHIFENSTIRIVGKELGLRRVVSIDTVLFEMLLMNLLVNAITYTKEEKPSIEIAVSNRKKTVDFAVIDQGVGVKKRDCKRIFKKFYQVGRAEDRSAKGTGLGLYLAACIVRIHKGRIKAEERSDRSGTIFTVSLPFGDDRAVSEQG